MLKKLFSALALLSLLLLGVSLYGVLTDPYEPYKRKFHLVAPDVMYQDLDRSFAQEGLSERFIADFITRFRSSVNYEWPSDAEYMPLQENWILYALRIADPFISKRLLSNPSTRIFGNVELPDYRKAVQRGFGICSQLSIAGADLLYSRYGVNARVAGLNGHVVIQVLGDHDANWVIDPSFKVYAKGSVLEPTKLPEAFFEGNTKIKSLYFDTETNFIAKRAGWGGYSYRSNSKQEALFYVVMASYYLKWLLPLFILAAYLVLHFWSRPSSRAASGAAQDGAFGLVSPVVK